MESRWPPCACRAVTRAQTGARRRAAPAGPVPPGGAPGLGLPGRGDPSCARPPAPSPCARRAVRGAHAAARARGPSPPCRGAPWRRIACRRPAAAHQFPEPTMHTFRGDAAMARAKCSSPARASPAGRWPPPAQPYPQLLPTAPPLPPLLPLHQWPRPPPPASARPQRTPGRTRPATPENHCARLGLAALRARLRNRPTPARGMPGLVVRAPCGRALR